MSHMVHVDMLDDEGNWKDSATPHFPVVPMTGDFITFGLATWEVLKRVIYSGGDSVIVAEITVKMVM